MSVTKRTTSQLRRRIALFLLFTLLNQIFAPAVSYALTSGPTAPEATNFEPIDTTDMVNTLTGGLTYNLPLIEVPGPEGSYPLALAYHAGVQPNEEASWVGLGWSLNPGAIARSVNGYADDFSDVVQSQRDYWVGGNRSTFGISLGLPCGVNFGLSFSKDTYQGFGVGASMGFGFNIPGSPLGIGITSGVDAYGNGYMGANLNIGTGQAGSQGLKLGGSVGISTNFQSTSANASGGISYTNGGTTSSLLGSSISSDGSKMSLTVGGGSANVFNANAGKIQTESSGFGFVIPLPYGASLGLSYNYSHYWSDETASVYTNGALYTVPEWYTSTTYWDNRTEDILHLADLEGNGIVPSSLQGGTYPEFDDYSVTAQGLSGSIRPYIYQSYLYGQNKNNVVYDSEGDTQSDIYDTTLIPNYMASYPSVQFRFINDFSNSYRQAPLSQIDPTHFNFDQPVYPSQGMDASKGQLAGSKHIAYFTNDQINSTDNSTNARSQGFIDTRSAGFTRMGSGQTGELSNTRGGKQIGGFVITNASGVSYHYALPVYSYNEYSYTATNAQDKFTGETRSEPYAYTWYLTAITGPDFVDRNGDGLADDGDWGYWVTFDYGKWTDQYGWRNPSEGFHSDVDPNYKSYSEGMKELYYLDAIRTRTHTAIFEKEVRYDAKGNTGRHAGINPGAGVYVASQFNFCYAPDPIDDFTGTGYRYPASTLRLDNIYLFANDQLPADINTIRQRSSNYNQSFTFSAGDQAGNSCADPSYTGVVHQGQNVIDKYDIDPSWQANCLRKIAFTYDYSLAMGEPNSYDGTPVYSATPGTPTQLWGKLALQSIDFQGKGAVSMTPPIKFRYDLDPNDPANQGTITLQYAPDNQPGVNQFGAVSLNTPNKFKPGDILTFMVGQTPYYCTLLSTTDNGATYRVLFLSSSPGSAAAGQSMPCLRTKNPPYNKDAYDIWGCYKSDYVPLAGNDNFSRLTSKLSSNNVDAWSLQRVETSLGAQISIRYEGDTYSKSALNKSMSLIVAAGSVNTSDHTVDLNVTNVQGLDLTQLFIPGQRLEGLFAVSRHFDFHESGIHVTTDVPVTINLSSYSSTILSVVDNDIKISADDNMWNALTTMSYNGAIENPATMNILTGNLKSSGFNLNYGGGIRVRDLIVDDLNGNIKKTSYNYNMPGQASTSSGNTSYEPFGLDIDNFNTIPNQGYVDVTTYRKILYNDISYLMPIARLVPAPGVMYEYVTVADSSILSNGSRVPMDGQVTYQYRMFNSGMIGIHAYPATQNFNSGQSFNQIYQKNLSIKDYTSQVGNLVRVIAYDTYGNKLSEKINHYLNDDIVNRSFEYQVANYESRLAAYNYQGVIQERYAEGRRGNDSSFPDYYTWLMTMSGHDEVPVIETGSTQIDYKNGTRTDQQIRAFDFYSGAVTQSITSDSYGNRFLTQITPAYRQYPAMGLKESNATNSNMLVQEASNYTFSIDASNNPIGVVTASAQTWANNIPVLDPDGNATSTGQSNIWRMSGSYKWMPTGSSSNNMTDYTSFADYFTPGGNTSWKNTAQVTKYNIYSAALEATDINTSFAATRMGYNNSKVLLTGGPAQYNEIAYAGAEDALLSSGTFFSTNVSKGGGAVVVDPTNAHTGTNSLLVPSGAQGFSYTLSGAKKQNYSVAVWVKVTPANVAQAQLYYQVAGGTPVLAAQSSAKTAAGWCLLEMTVPAAALDGASDLVVWCKNASTAGLYFDDFRFQPTAAATTAYVYDNKTGELTYILGNKNLYVHYQYDAIGRLVSTYKEVLGKTNIPIASTIAYNYGQHIYHNGPVSQTFYNLNCGAGLGQPYVYTVNANVYSSTISPQDAYNQALQDVLAHGQTAANTYGTCWISYSLSNSTNSGYQVNFSNTAGSYTFDFSDNGSKSVALPPGVYSVDIYPTGPYVVHTITLGTQPSVSAPRHNFDNVDVSSGRTDLNITIY